MATFKDRLAVLIDADVKGFVSGMEKAGRSAESELQKADDARNRFSNRMVQTGGVMVGVAGVMAVGLAKTVTSALDAEKSQIRLANSVKGSKVVADSSIDAFNDQAKAIQNTTVANDELVNSIQSQLVQMKLSEDEVLQLTPLIVDISRKMGLDFVTAAKSVGRAVNGNQGAMKKLGIVVDEAAFANDSYTATMHALREAAGGFATEEGKTFEGQLKILENQIDEFKESVGRGVIGVLQDVLPAATSAAQGIGSVDEATGGMIGQVATVATVVTGATGGILVLAGSVSKLSTAFGEGGALAGRFGVAVKGIAGAGAVLAGAELAASALRAGIEQVTGSTEESRDAIVKFGGDGKRSVDAFAESVKRAGSSGSFTDALTGDISDLPGVFAKNFRQIQDEGTETAAEIKRQFRSIVDASPSVAKELLKGLRADPALKDFGGTLDELGRMIDKEVTKRARLANAAKDDAEMVQRHADAERAAKGPLDASSAATRSATVADEARTKALEEETHALESRNTATIASFSSDLAAIQANNTLGESITDGSDALTIQQNALSAAGASAQAAADDYEALHGEAATAEQKTGFFKEALLRLAEQFPQLTPAILTYIGQLNLIPPEKKTTPTFDDSAARAKVDAWIARLREVPSGPPGTSAKNVDGTADRDGNPWTPRMAGGPVPGSPSQGVPILAHGGEYVLDAGTVDAIKSGRQSRGAARGTAGGVSGVTNVYLIQTTVMSARDFDRQVVSALDRHVRRTGQGHLRALTGQRGGN